MSDILAYLVDAPELLLIFLFAAILLSASVRQILGQLKNNSGGDPESSNSDDDLSLSHEKYLNLAEKSQLLSPPSTESEKPIPKPSRSASYANTSFSLFFGVIFANLGLLAAGSFLPFWGALEIGCIIAVFFNLVMIILSFSEKAPALGIISFIMTVGVYFFYYFSWVVTFIKYSPY